MSFPNRRDFLRASGAAALGTLSLQSPAAADEKSPVAGASTLTVIDCHTHFYDPTRPQGVPWPGKDNKLLYRRVLPADFKAVAAPHGVHGTVIVEASPWVEDNQWLLDVADDDPFVVGIVGHLAPGTEDFAGHLARFTKNRLFRGIRVNHNVLKPGLESKAFVDDLRRLADADCSLDINGLPDLLPTATKLARTIPGLRIVVNHVANVTIDGRKPPQEWQDGMRAAAENENVFCKVSGLVSGAGRKKQPAPDDPNFYVPVLDVVWNAFGADRLIYGSDWPVSERYAPYGTVKSIPQEYIEGKGVPAVQKFFGTNALTAYKWICRN